MLSLVYMLNSTHFLVMSFSSSRTTVLPDADTPKIRRQLASAREPNGSSPFFPVDLCPSLTYDCCLSVFVCMMKWPTLTEKQTSSIPFGWFAHLTRSKPHRSLRCSLFFWLKIKERIRNTVFLNFEQFHRTHRSPWIWRMIHSLLSIH